MSLVFWNTGSLRRETPRKWVILYGSGVFFQSKQIKQLYILLQNILFVINTFDLSCSERITKYAYFVISYKILYSLKEENYISWRTNHFIFLYHPFSNFFVYWCALVHLHCHWFQYKILLSKNIIFNLIWIAEFLQQEIF